MTLSNIEKILGHAEQQCNAHGSRLTEKRKQVLSGLVQSKKALSAYELIEVCKQQSGESISAMSVYRILDFLAQEELVHKLNLANKYVACTHISCDHAHGVPQFLICSRCHKVEEISIDASTIEELQASVKQADFTLVSPQLEMDCLCNNCVAMEK